MTQVDLDRLWEEHINHEFSTREADSTLATTVEDAYVNHVPVMTGGVGKSALHFLFRGFHSEDAGRHEVQTYSPDGGRRSAVDEMIFSFTHTQEMPWMLPGIPPTNRYVDVALVVIVRFRDGKDCA